MVQVLRYICVLQNSLQKEPEALFKCWNCPDALTVRARWQSGQFLGGLGRIMAGIGLNGGGLGVDHASSHAHHPPFPFPPFPAQTHPVLVLRLMPAK